MDYSRFFMRVKVVLKPNKNLDGKLNLSWACAHCPSVFHDLDFDGISKNDHKNEKCPCCPALLREPLGFLFSRCTGLALSREIKGTLQFGCGHRARVCAQALQWFQLGLRDSALPVPEPCGETGKWEGSSTAWEAERYASDRDLDFISI